MKKISKDNNQNIILILSGVLVIAALLILSGAVEVRNLRLGSIVSSGLTIDSISLANPPVQGQQNEWIVSAHATGFGQSITGNLGNKDITYQGSSAKYPLSISGSISENKGLYIINNANPKVMYKYTVSQKQGTFNDYIFYSSITPPAACDGTPAYVIKGYLPSGWLLTGSSLYQNVCVYKTNVATVAPISSLPNIYPTINLNVNVNGQTQTVTLDSMGVKALPNGMGSVAWTNSPLQSGSTGALSIGQQFMALAPFNTASWRVVYANDYTGSGLGQSWVDTANQADQWLGQSVNIAYADAGCPVGSVSGTRAETITKLNNIATCYFNVVSSKIGGSNSAPNNIADRLLSSNLNIKINDQPATTSYDGTKNGFWVDLGSVYATAPQLQFRIKSDWLGIVFPNGIPQVISTTGTPNPFSSGTPLAVTITVKNIGDGQGNFAVQGVTGGTLKTQSQVYPVAVAPGQTGTIIFSMVTSGSQAESGTISGKVVDTGSLKESQFSLGYSMTVPSQCTNGKTYWNGGNKIQTCQNNVLIDLTFCEFGVAGDGQGGWKCAINPNTGGGTPGATGGGGGSSINADKLNWYDTTPAKILAGLIVVLVILLVWRKQNE